MSEVPRTVHRLWIGGPEPEWLAGFAATWERPGWTLRRWDDESVAELFPLRNQAVYDGAPAIAPDHVGQLRSDVLRYEILHRFGGVWVDADFECLRPIDPLLAGVECFAAWEQPRRWINQAILGAVPGHPFIDSLIDGLPASVEANRGFKPNRMSGPQFVTAQWLHHGRGVKIFDRELFYPYGFAEIADHGPGEEWPNAYAAHHWGNRRREKAVPA